MKSNRLVIALGAVIASYVLVLGAAQAQETVVVAETSQSEEDAPDTPLDSIEPAVSTSPSAVTRRATADGVIDELDLESTRVTGNQELPKVLYIVPWKQADLGDLVGRPVNSLLDEVLEPVDRDVFRRQNRYYQSLYGAADEIEE